VEGEACVISDSPSSAWAYISTKSTSACLCTMNVTPMLNSARQNPTREYLQVKDTQGAFGAREAGALGFAHCFISGMEEGLIGFGSKKHETPPRTRP